MGVPTTAIPVLPARGHHPGLHPRRQCHGLLSLGDNSGWERPQEASNPLPRARPALGAAQAAEGLVRWWLETLRVWRWHSLSGQPSHGRKFPRYTQTEPLSFQSLTVVSCPPAMQHCVEPGSVISNGSSQTSESCH